MDTIKNFSLLILILWSLMLTSCSNDEEALETKKIADAFTFKTQAISNPENSIFGLREGADCHGNTVYSYHILADKHASEIVIKTDNLDKLYIESVEYATPPQDKQYSIKRTDNSFTSELHGWTISQISDNLIKIEFHEIEDPQPLNYQGEWYTHWAYRSTIEVIDPSRKKNSKYIDIIRSSEGIAFDKIIPIK